MTHASLAFDTPRGCSPVDHWQTGDIEQHARSMSGWQVHYDQVTAGRFSGQMSELHLPGMQLIRDRANQAMIKTGAAWDGAVTFSMPLGVGDHSFHCAGHAITGSSLLVSRGDQLPELRAPANLDLLCIAVQETQLNETLDRQNHARLPPLPLCYLLDPKHDHTALASLFKSVLDSQNDQTTAMMGHETIRAGIRDAVMLHLVDLLDSAEVQPLSPSARKRMVDRAREFALARPDDTPTILELCNQIGASRRKLQYCFQQTLGTNPVAYLRALRLNTAHRRLLAANSTDSVQDIAAQCGFWHLSRFATDYKQLFGERPSQTLQRSRHICAENG